jgi:hypothetical protein
LLFSLVTVLFWPVLLLLNHRQPHPHPPISKYSTPRVVCDVPSRAALKLYNDQRNAQFFNLFIYLLLPYMFRVFYYPNFWGRCTTSAVVQVSWVWCQRPGADTIPRKHEPLPQLYTCLWRWAKRKPETCKAEVNR